MDQTKSRHQEDIQSLQNVDSCRNDLKKLWIRFKFRGEAQEIRSKGNYPAEIKKILERMGIKFNLGILPLESAFFQDRKFGGNSIPEVALCCNFINSTIARRVKLDIMNFNKALEEAGQLESIRYFTIVNWSEKVWNILRICFELKNNKLITNAFVTNEGIKVQYNVECEPEDPDETFVDPSLQKFVSVLINTQAALDNLRKTIGDFNYQLPATVVYNSEYFNLSKEQRIEHRIKSYEEQHESDDCFMQAESTNIV